MTKHVKARGRWLLLAAVLIGTSLGSGQVGEGPLHLGGGGTGVLCSPLREGGSILLGEVVQVPQGPITVEALDLVRPVGLRVVDAVVFPIDGLGIGSSVGPPVDIPSWRERVPAAGAQLAAGTTYNVVVEVSRLSDADASAQAMAMTYSARGVEHSTVGTTRYELKDACS